ncbi:MAG TPA: hypothetical protein VGK59_01740 [Ohtaekwangia sp.]
MSVGLFFLLVGVTLSVVVFYFSYRFNNPAIYKLKPSVDLVIIGDSHIQCGLEDSLFQNSINVSNSADSYLFTYIKIRRLVEHNPGIKKVMLGYSAHNLEQSMDNWNFRDENLRNKTAQYFFLMGLSEVKFLAKRNPFAFVRGIIQFPKIKFNTIRSLNKKSDVLDIGVGGHQRLTEVIYDWKGYDPKVMADYIQACTLSESQEIYLNKIIDLCRLKGIELILISTPLHPTYSNRDQGCAKKYHTINLDNIHWCDFTHLDLADSLFADHEHLNQNGAIVFSKHLKNNLGW